jgi:hypothetical protein
MPNRRSFLSLLGVGAAAGPLAVKAAADAEIGKLSGISYNALASTGLGLAGGQPVPSLYDAANGMSYSQQLINAAHYVKIFGLPEFVEFELRDQSKWINSLDPDIACKKSWSMSVKILEQRERNYQRAVDRMHRTGWQQEKRSAIKTILGFAWPF